MGLITVILLLSGMRDGDSEKLQRCVSFWYTAKWLYIFKHISGIMEKITATLPQKATMKELGAGGDVN